MFRIILFYLIFVNCLYSQSNYTKNSLKQKEMDEIVKLKFEVLGARLSVGSYQTEQGRFEFPVDITVNDSGKVTFNVFLNCNNEKIEENITIINDQINIVFSGISSILTEFKIDKEMNDCVSGKLYNYYSPKPIGFWKGTSFYFVDK